MVIFHCYVSSPEGMKVHSLPQIPGFSRPASAPRPVLSTRPLRRPSSAAALDKGRLDELLAQAEAVKDEAGEYDDITGM